MPTTADEGLLDACRRGYAEARLRLARLLEDLGEASARRRPGPKAWSVTECLDHVAITNDLYLERLGPVIEAARAKGRSGAPPYGRGTLLGRFILGNLRQGPNAPRVPAPRVFRPHADVPDLATVSGRVRAGLERLEDLAAEAEGLPLGALRVRVPAGPFLRVSAAQAFEMTDLHTHRHLGQAERTRAATREA